MPFVEADGAPAPSLQQPGCSRPPKPPLKGGVQSGSSPFRGLGGQLERRPYSSQAA